MAGMEPERFETQSILDTLINYARSDFKSFFKTLFDF
jgi:hypothetical protein